MGLSIVSQLEIFHLYKILKMGRKGIHCKNYNQRDFVCKKWKKLHFKTWVSLEGVLDLSFVWEVLPKP